VLDDNEQPVPGVWLLREDELVVVESYPTWQSAYDHTYVTNLSHSWSTSMRFDSVSFARLEEHHPELLERALAIERNAQAKLRSVKGLGRSYAWQSFVSKRRE
jgi:hypothetical protein